MTRSVLMILLVTRLAGSTTDGADDRVLAKERRTQSPATTKFAFELPAVPKNMQVRLGLQARIDWKNLGGSNPWILVTVNDDRMTGRDLINKPLEFTMLNGMDTTWAYGPWWRICYAPGFTDELRTAKLPYAIPDTDPYGFVWDITPYVKPGKNVLVVHHKKVLSQGSTLVLRDIRVEVGKPIPSKSRGKVSPAPTGPLPTRVAQGSKPVKIDVGPANADVRITAAGRTFELCSRTSAPGGKWAEAGAGQAGSDLTAEWTAPNHRVMRKITVHDDHVHLADTITNTTEGLIGVILEHRLRLADGPAKVLLGGRPALEEASVGGHPAHPTALAIFDDFAVGLVAEDDIFRVHVETFREPDAIGLRDRQLGIGPGKSHTLRWSIYPVPRGDYWDFINAVRRNWGANYTIPYAVCFDPSAGASKRSLQEHRKWLTGRKLAAVVSGQTYFVENGVQPKGILAEGTAIPMAKVWCENTADWIDKIHQINPSAKVLIYIHAQICTEPDAPQRYVHDRLLDAEGNHVKSPYRYPVHIYLSTPGNTYGKALMRAADETLRITVADGFYCDEFAWATKRYAYETTWDGCTVTINPKTHAVGRRRSSVTLLQQPWKVAFVKRLREQGKEIIANGPAQTRTALDLHVPRFTEMASYSFLINTHLQSPWGLGNHEAPPGDRGRATKARRFLDHAGVFTTYVWPDEPEAPPFLHLMYPITPVELRAGMVLAEERILTNRSGRYGWPDNSTAEIHVIDADGRQIDDPNIREVHKSGRRLYEVRMPSDHFAILVRKPEREPRPTE